MIGLLDIHLNVNCDACGKEFDMFDTTDPDETMFIWDTLCAGHPVRQPLEWNCPHCDKITILEDIEYLEIK